MNYIESAISKCEEGDAEHLADSGLFIQYYTCYKNSLSEDKRWNCVNGIIDDSYSPTYATAEKEIRLPRFIPPRLIYPDYVFHSYDKIAKRLRLNQTARKPNKE